MSANTQFLENPWRIRGLDAPAEVRIDPKLSALAKVTEASLSGAFIETRARLSIDSAIAVRPIPEAGAWINARVLRLEDDGAEIQWVHPRLDYLAILLTERPK